MPKLLTAGADQDFYLDESITLTFTPSTDLSNANDISVDIYDGSFWIDWGAEGSGVAADTEVALTNEPESLPTPITTAGFYRGRWQYTDAQNNTDTLRHFIIEFEDPDDGTV